MKKLFYEDTHILDFEAKVLDCQPYKQGGFQVVLDQTAFFPEEGGQAADTGVLDGQEIVDVRIKEDIIYHIVKEPIEVGATVNGHVNWDRRFDFMQQHTGEHVISGLLNKYYGYENVGFHLGLEEVTMDVNGTLSMEEWRKIELEANQVVWKNIPVKASFPSKEELASLTYRSKIEIEGDIRIVEIEGVDMCACCAPHVDSTGQIGMIKIMNVQNHRGGVRLNILCGERALKEFTFKQDQISSLSVLLSSKPEKVVETVEKLHEDFYKQKGTEARLTEELMSYLVTSLPSPEETNNAVLFCNMNNMTTVRNSVNDLVAKYPGYSAIFSGDDENGYTFILGSKSLDCKEIGNKLRSALLAKCGGSSAMIQGNIAATKEQIMKVL